jgi:hypothetical protein
MLTREERADRYSRSRDRSSEALTGPELPNVLKVRPHGGSLGVGVEHCLMAAEIDGDPGGTAVVPDIADRFRAARLVPVKQKVSEFPLAVHLDPAWQEPVIVDLQPGCGQRSLRRLGGLCRD